jgi:aldehyde:ferredoxin oxidoreductase
MEYESTYALGPLLGIADPNTVIRASHLCDDLGIDTISTGVTIAWAMECFEKGILTRKDTSGIELKFGNTEAILPILYMISKREGIGDLLADGCLRAAKAVGSNSEDWAMQVKGLEMPGYEPRSLKTMALGLAVSTRGACHNRSSAYEADFSALVDRLSVDEVKGQITKQGEDFSSVLDSLIWCKFLRKAFQDFYTESAAIYEYVTGFNMDDKQLRLAGERINNLKKLFNIREGWSREDDTLPLRSLQEKLPTGIVKGEILLKEDLDIMIASYYKARGWTKRGLIPKNKLEELELSNFN